MNQHKHPRISVVIPAFNEAGFLPACLEAVNKQTFRDYEVIVVDNNSTDDTAQIAKKYGARVVKEKKQGLIAARERGFREAKADILARTDADTLVPDDWLEKIDLAFKNHPDAVGFSGPIFKSGGILSFFGKIYSLTAEKILFKTYVGQDCFLGPNMVIKKSAWEKTRVCGDETEVLEDLDLSYHLAKTGKVLFLPELAVSSSTRRMRENPVRGVHLYLVQYISRYFKTLKCHQFDKPVSVTAT